MTMAKTVPVEIRLADLPQVQKFLVSVNNLIRTLDEAGDLPEPVMTAAAWLRHDVAALFGWDARTLPVAPSGEDRIRDAMARAHDHPGRTR